ncbi:hypothetical protein AXG93_3410s1050 [Marchantia polymorpha subsp. ruderalis]|uniref:Uncharacterized protein n=1 Tax=Marchantia polymorpha subsp. ruderalis TaxID=1480154 RepID=A0A176W6H2_MARPO|nr:hypothetical protein AXG93_3410s1050 [Marchantia polymorpha subsp. ruderalis]
MASPRCCRERGAPFSLCLKDARIQIPEQKRPTAFEITFSDVGREPRAVVSKAIIQWVCEVTQTVEPTRPFDEKLRLLCVGSRQISNMSVRQQGPRDWSCGGQDSTGRATSRAELPPLPITSSDQSSIQAQRSVRLTESGLINQPISESPNKTDDNFQIRLFPLELCHVRSVILATAILGWLAGWLAGGAKEMSVKRQQAAMGPGGSSPESPDGHVYRNGAASSAAAIAVPQKAIA